MTPGKTIALTIQTFVSKVMSLLFNILSRLVIAFLLEDNIGQNLSDLGLGKDFLHTTLQSQLKKKNTNILDLKFKNSALWRILLRDLKDEPWIGKKIFAKHTFNKGFVSEDKELKQRSWPVEKEWNWEANVSWQCSGFNCGLPWDTARLGSFLQFGYMSQCVCVCVCVCVCLCLCLCAHSHVQSCPTEVTQHTQSAP